MRVSINGGAVSTLLGLAGTGAAWALPEMRWLGFTLIVLSIIVFGFNVRVERSQLAAGRNRMLPYYVLVGSGLVFAFSLLWIVMHLDPEPNRSPPSVPREEVQLDDTSRPTLLDLFMTEFTGTFTGQTLVLTKEFVFKDGHHERFLESRFYDYINNSNYMSFYIGTTGWEKIVEYITKKNKAIAAELPPFTFDAKAEGADRIVRIEDTVFSGKIFIYIPTIFDVERLAEIIKLGRDNGCFIEIRGTEYEELMKQNLRKYSSKVPAHYDIVDGNAILLRPEINLGGKKP